MVVYDVIFNIVVTQLLKALSLLLLCSKISTTHFWYTLCKVKMSIANVVNFEVNETITIEKVLAFIAWILLQFPCNGMMVGLIQYERLGGDPLKRRLSDQVCKKCKNCTKVYSTKSIVS